MFLAVHWSIRLLWSFLSLFCSFNCLCQCHFWQQQRRWRRRRQQQSQRPTWSNHNFSAFLFIRFSCLERLKFTDFVALDVQWVSATNERVEKIWGNKQRWNKVLHFILVAVVSFLLFWAGAHTRARVSTNKHSSLGVNALRRAEKKHFSSLLCV